MKTILTIIVCLLSFACRADNEFADSFEIQMGKLAPLADNIAAFYTGKKDILDPAALNTLEAARTSIEKEIRKKPDSRLYFLKGLNLSLLSGIYQKTAPRRLEQTIQEKEQAYAQAMLLDDKNPSRLSAIAYASMKYALPDELKIKAIQKELKLGGSGDTESQYWYLHWSNIHGLQQAGRFKEARQAIANMKKELKKSGLDASPYGQIASKAETELEREIKNRKRKNKVSPKEKADKPAIEKQTLIIAAISIMALLAILAITFYELKIKKRKG